MNNITPTVRNLLLANLLVYLIQANLPVGDLLTRAGSLYSLQSGLFYPWQLVTYMFLHSGLWHLAGNMIGLLTLGPLLEQRWGGQRFLVFWMVCGVGAGVLYEGARAFELHRLDAARAEVVASPDAATYDQFMSQMGIGRDVYQAAAKEMQQHPRDPAMREGIISSVEALYQAAVTTPSLGASGAVFGVMLAFAYLFPNTRLMMIYFPVPIKAKYFVGLYILYELFSGVHRIPGDNIAHFAHLGGALVAFIILKVWERGRTRFY